MVPRRQASPSWLVVDNAQRIAGGDLLSALMRARDVTGANLGLVLLSSLSWGTGRFLRDTVTALPCADVHFPAYLPDQLTKARRAGGCSVGVGRRGEEGPHSPVRHRWPQGLTLTSTPPLPLNR